MDIVSRLKQFMESTRMASSQFADTAQIPRPTLSQIMSGRNKKISNEIIGKLHEAFPQLNVIWLLFGDGDMLTTAKNNTETQAPANFETSEPIDGANLFDSIDYVPYGKEFNDTTDSMQNASAIEAEKNRAPSKPYPPFHRPHHDTPYQPDTTVQPTQPAQPTHPARSPQPTMQQPSQTVNPLVAATEAADKTKHIASIMVFYTDSSFETFYPSSKTK